MGERVRLGEIGQIALTVRDVERATGFYRDVLGMDHLFGAGTMSFFQCGGVRLMLVGVSLNHAAAAELLVLRLAQVHEALSDVDKSKGYYQDLVDAAPDSALGREAQKRIDALSASTCPARVCPTSRLQWRFPVQGHILSGSPTMESSGESIPVV